MERPASTSLNSYLNTALTAAHKGGEVLKKYWKTTLNIQDKSTSGDLVTQADKESESAIIEVLKAAYPTHAFLAEESGPPTSKESDFLWVIDPLDGTVNYAHHNPFVSISMALTFKQEILVALVFNPIFQEMFTAVKGQGAQLNGESIHVSSTKSLAQSLLASGFAYDRRTNPDTNYPEFSYLTHLSHGVRRYGSAALDLAYVAAGRFDGYWERGIKPWDIAAGVLLVTEAGGKVSAYDGSLFDLYAEKVLATNGHIHPEISQELLSIKSHLTVNLLK